MSSARAIRRDEGERLARVSTPSSSSSSSSAQPSLLTPLSAPPRIPQEYSVPFMETSAKTGVNVELAFTAVSKYEPS